MDETTARRKIANTEDEHTERKTSSSHFDKEKLFSYIAALSNEGGGSLILGVDDNGAITGTEAFKLVPELKQEILTSVNLSRRLRVEIDELMLDGKRVLIFSIPSRPKGEAIAYKGTYLMRSGSSVVPMNFDTLADISDELVTDFSAEVIEGATIADLDANALSKARELWFLKSQNAHVQSMSDEELLAGLDLGDERGITRAGIILLGTLEAIKRYVPNSELVWEYRKYATDIEFAARKDYKQPFVLYFDDLWRQIDARSDVAHVNDGFLIRDIPAFNEEVVREAVLNAVAHRDYRDTGSVFVRQSPEYLLIESPGGFVDGVTPENIIEISSRPRNRRIAEAFQKFGLVERSGQGADKIFRQTIAAGKGLPDYSGSTQHEVKLQVSAQIQDLEFIKYLEKVAQETKVKLSAKDYVVLERVRQDIYRTITEHPGLQHLMELGLVEKARSGRFTKPILSKRFYIAFDKRGEYTRQKGLGKNTNLELILKHLTMHRKGYARDIEQVLPHVDRTTINRYLDELAKQGKIEIVGNRYAAHGKGRVHWQLKK